MYVDRYSQQPALNVLQCAVKILGLGDPRVPYGQFDIQIWRDNLQAELGASGLPGAIQRLTREVVERARINTLLREADIITK